MVILIKKWKCRDISRGICPTVMRLPKTRFLILMAHAYGSTSCEDFFCFHLNCNFFSHFGICPRSIFLNMVTPWSNSCSEWISLDDGFAMCCTLFQIRNTKKICLNLNSQNLNSRIWMEFESLFECRCCCCRADFISLLLTIEEIVRK